MIAIVKVEEKTGPNGIVVNPEITITCPPGSIFTSKKYSNSEIAKMMRKAALKFPNLSFDNVNLAVINHHIGLGFRLVASSVISSQNCLGPAYEFYMEMPKSRTPRKR